MKISGFLAGMIALILSSCYVGTSVEPIKHQVATPTFSPAPGDYISVQTVNIVCNTPYATIYYTLDGTTPSSNSTVFTTDLYVSTNATIKAIAVRPNLLDSQVVSANYSIRNYKGFTWIENTKASNEVTITKYVGNKSNIVIPSVIDGKPVTTIGANTFYGNSSLTYVTIPNSVTSIGNMAFYLCTGLTNIVLPNSIQSIGSQSFSYCTGLKEITLPNSIASVAYGAFSGCSGLKSVKLPDLLTSINSVTFYGCTNLTNITFPNSLSNIGNWAFYGCSGLTTITFPDSLTSIKHNAFEGCSRLKSITLPAALTSVGEAAFANCSALTNISVDPVNTNFKGINGILFSRDESKLIQYPAGKNEPSYTIPNAVTTLGNSAFVGCTRLTNINLPDSINLIGNSTFVGCTNLKTIIIPNSVTNMGEDTFKNCTGLTNIIIPNSVSNIGGGTFEYCTGLTNINLPNSLTYIDYMAFFGCTGLEQITLPDSVTSIGWESFGYTGLKAITLPVSLNHIGSGAFYVSARLKIITVEATNPPQLEDDAFIPYSICGDSPAQVYPSDFVPSPYVDTIPTRNFYVPQVALSAYQTAPNWGIHSFEMIGITETSNEVAITEYSGNKPTIYIPPSLNSKPVTSIGNSAFDHCTNLTEIILPDSLTRIESNAFYNCTSLTNVTLEATNPPSLGGNAFNDNATGRKIYVPSGSVSTYQAQWSDYASDITNY